MSDDELRPIEPRPVPGTSWTEEHIPQPPWSDQDLQVVILTILHNGRKNLQEAQKTNGRVTKLERDVGELNRGAEGIARDLYGVKIGSHKHTGLIDQVDSHKPVVEDANRLIRQVRAILTTVVAILIPVAAGLLLLILDRLTAGSV